MRTLTQAIEFADVVKQYARFRRDYPELPARLAYAWSRDDSGQAIDEFICAHTGGHDFQQYGDNYHGEGRLLCSQCGADGDG